MKLDYSKKIRAHGLFLKKEDFCLLILKMGELSEAYLELHKN
jgi:hypothetical protein